ncbi:putative Thiopurine S-methyltransferase [Cupriavidus taiwanensis]|uniref:methyltransferase domain-containing protein n=1 Tax=Cupriavidus taiwanensis TaxID=164546 RepID=UPI000E1329A2|nr:methyltransferase domain-containing protein [Cupriavidus taiwanensis]SOZ15120.1 putative Thiopurine S-methyltransferase [Cupriavidus taiwanensis]SOZ27200.1 putative Thiopurine S-methyltransferase [Cupriavidus taiwanensis]SOZ45693.1 putative Thiopurine S-methyltransferase [Cupriavidus taiwanensis]SOZ99678.1 putative Thiopurine S-methyltransferase [Cupriavidus taiwanensis]SPA13451.1 putative Thiopurine S-methyltransferase [Cupriavidus taiwanensis]
MSDTTRPVPSFATRDAGDPAFWDERFKEGFTPWDLGGVPEEFRRFIDGRAPCPTLVPGCGNGWEAAWLFERGWPVTAIDFSPQAVASARRALGPAGAVVQQGDFFAFTPQPACELIYERAFLCALPPALRAAYGARVAGLLPPGGLLAGYFYLGENRGGPPFAMPQAELDALLAPAFERTEDRPSAAPLPVFQGQERWQVWRRRGA